MLGETYVFCQKCNCCCGGSAVQEDQREVASSQYNTAVPAQPLAHMAVRWVQLPAHSIAFLASLQSSALDSKQEIQRVHLLNQNEVQAWWSQCCHTAGL